MSDKVKLRIVDLLVTLFTFVIPIGVVVTTYFTVETTAKVAWSLIGIVLLTIILLAWVNSIKKKIIIRQQSGFKPSPYKVMIVNKLPPLAFIGIFYWFLTVIEEDIDKLSNVILVIFVSVIIGFVLNFFSTRLEIKLSQ